MSELQVLLPRNRILRLLGTLLALSLLVYLLSRQGWGEFLGALRTIPLSSFALILGLAFLSRLAVAGRWASLLIGAGVDLSILRIVKIAYAGMFAANFLPTSIGGDIVRFAGTMAVDEKKAIYASSIVMDRLVGGIGMAALLPVGVVSLINAREIPQLLDWLRALPVSGATLSNENSSLEDRIRVSVRKLSATTKAWFEVPRALLVAFLFTWLYMLMKFLSMWLMFRAMGESIGLVEVGGLWTFVYLINLFPLTINSIGLQEISAGLVYSTLGQVSETHALAMAVLLRTSEMLASLPGALTLPGMLEKPVARIATQPPGPQPGTSEKPSP